MESRWTLTKVRNDGAEYGTTAWWTSSNTTVENGGVAGSKVFKISSSGSMSQTINAFRFQPAQIKVVCYYYSATAETENVNAFLRYTVSYVSGKKSHLVVPFRQAYDTKYPGLAGGNTVNYLYFEDLLAILDTEVLDEITVEIITDEHGGDVYIDEAAVYFDLGVTEVYGRESETPTINDKGINSNFLKNFKNMLHNSQFEAYNAATEQPFFWTCSNSNTKTTAASNFFGTRCVQIPVGQNIIYDGTGKVDPTWYDSQRTRISFYCRNGTLRVEVWDYTDVGSPVRFTLTNEEGAEALYHDYAFASWHGGTGNSASRGVISFEPGVSTDIRVKFTNVSGTETSYLDAVVLEPDFTNQWPSIYTDGPYSLFPASVGVYAQDYEPTGVAVQVGSLWLNTDPAVKRWYFWDGSQWVQTAGGGGEGTPGLYPGSPAEITELILTKLGLSTDVTETISHELLSFTGATLQLFHFNSDDGVGYTLDEVAGYRCVLYNSARIFKAISDTGYMFFTSGYYLQAPDHASFDFGNGDFTIDMEVNYYNLPPAISTTSYVLYSQRATATTNYCCQLSLEYVSATGKYYLRFAYTTNGTTPVTVIDYEVTPSLFAWHHVAIIRSGTTVYLGYDGTLVASGSIGTATLYNSTAVVKIAATNTTTTGYMYGFLRRIRVSKGIARWTTNFTVPTGYYSNDANTSLLIQFKENMFVTTLTDESSNAHTITGSNTGVLKKEKFGAGNLDFTTNASAYAIIPFTYDWALAAKDFTIDFWVILKTLPATSTAMTFFSRRVSATTGNMLSVFVYNNAGTYQLRITYSYAGGAGTVSNTNYTFATSTWYHVAIVRNGTSMKAYINGTSIVDITVGTNALSGGSISNDTVDTYLGATLGTSVANFLNGLIEEFRLKDGAVWTSNFTPPITEHSV